VTACDSDTYSMRTCTVFDLHSIQCFITHRTTGIGIGIGYWQWHRPILLGIGNLVWYRSNPILVQILHTYYTFLSTLDYTIHIFIRLPPTSTKLCHIKGDHLYMLKMSTIG